MRSIRTIQLFVMLCTLVTLAACSGAPRGSFPANAGGFKLVEGPVAQKPDPENDWPAYFLSEYRSEDGASVAHQVMPFASAERAQKELAEKREGMIDRGSKVSESDGKVIYTKSSGMTTVYWTINNWYCYAASTKEGAALKLANALQYK